MFTFDPNEECGNDTDMLVKTPYRLAYYARGGINQKVTRWTG